MAHPQTPRDLLVYDGDCAFCTLWVTRLQSWLPAFPETRPSQHLDVAFWGLSEEDVRDYVWLLTPREHLAGAAAVAGLLRRQPRWGLRLLGHLLDTWPISLLSELAYRAVARNRHLLPGSTPHCEIPVTRALDE